MALYFVEAPGKWHRRGRGIEIKEMWLFTLGIACYIFTSIVATRNMSI